MAQLSEEMDGRPLAFNPTPKFLSIKFDRMFSFAEQATEVTARMVKGYGLLKALAGSDWGSGRSTNLSSKVFDYCAAGCQPWLPLPVLGHWIRHVTNA